MRQSEISPQQSRAQDAGTTELPDSQADHLAQADAAARLASRKRRWGTWLLRGTFALAALGWLVIVGLSVTNPAFGSKVTPFLEIAIRLSTPLLLVVGLALFVMMLLGHWDNDDDHERNDSAEARDLASQAAQSASRIAEAHALLLHQTKNYAAVADRSATALLEAVALMAERNEQLSQSTNASVTALAALKDRMDLFDQTAPQIEQRIARLTETMLCLGAELGERSAHLEGRLKEAAAAAEHTRTELAKAGDDLNGRLDVLQQGTKAAGEELANLSELSSARIDLTLDRVQTVLDATESRIDAQNEALTALVGASRASVEAASNDALTRFQSHCDAVAATLDKLDQRINDQSEKGREWLEMASAGAIKLSDQFDALESSAVERSERLGRAMLELSCETRRLVDAMEGGEQSSEQLIRRAESLVLVLNSGVRELDEHIPDAIVRVEERLASMRKRIGDAAPAIEMIESSTQAIAERMDDARQLSTNHATTLDSALARSQQMLGDQKDQIEALANAISFASQSMEKLSDKVGPQMVESLLRVRETADAAARKARDAIMDIIPQTANSLGDASQQALQRTMGDAVEQQIARLTQTADQASQTADAVASQLEARLNALQVTTEALETRLAGSAQKIDRQDREYLTQRSAELIEMLNNRAIDVAKWLGHDISQPEWTAYLKGDQGMFARRAVKMLGRSEARAIQTLYRDDVDFAEHVNRYVHDFETLLKAILGARDGSALAVTMVSSDLGKLYVALAQASERLRAS